MIPLSLGSVRGVEGLLEECGSRRLFRDTAWMVLLLI